MKKYFSEMYFISAKYCSSLLFYIHVSILLWLKYVCIYIYIYIYIFKCGNNIKVLYELVNLIDVYLLDTYISMSCR